jgi:hypothetical protein
VQKAIRQIINDALLFSDMRFQRVEAGGGHLLMLSIFNLEVETK